MNRWSLARQFFVGQLLFVLVLVGTLSWVLYVDSEQETYGRTSERMLAVATTLADDPFVRRTVAGPDPSGALQPYATQLTADLGIDFVTMMAPDRTRYTHPNPEQIGGEYIGSVEQALAGRAHTEVHTGTLGPSVRAIAPVRGEDGEVIALVAAGVTVDRVEVAVDAQLPLLFLLAGGALAGGTAVSALLARRLKKATLGLGAEQLSRMFTLHDAMLHSVREGLLLSNRHGELVLYNRQAAQLLGLAFPAQGPQPDGSGMDSSSAGLPESIRDLLRSARPATDEVHLTGDRVLVVSQSPALPAARGTDSAGSLGTVTTLRDHTDIASLAGELRGMQTLTDALRAQTHEHANRLHTIVSLIELDRRADALEFATRDLEQSQQLTDQVVAALDEPFVTALLVGKAAQAHERGIDFTVTVNGQIDDAGIGAADLVTIVGNLLDNAFDAVTDVGIDPRADAGAFQAPALPPAPPPGSAARRVELELACTGTGLRIRVRNNGPDLDPGEAGQVFTLGFSTKAAAGRGIGLALVRQAALRAGGTVHAENDGGACFTVELPRTFSRTTVTERTAAERNR
jgi:two-component system CitB family sensor kinase